MNGTGGALQSTNSPSSGNRNSRSGSRNIRSKRRLFRDVAGDEMGHDSLGNFKLLLMVMDGGRTIKNYTRISIVSLF